MKEVVHISVLWKSISPEAYRQLIQMHPEGRSPGGFACELNIDSRIAVELIGFLEKQGLQRHGSAGTGRFGCKHHRIYDDDDFAAADYLVMFPTEEVGMPDLTAQSRDENGRAILTGQLPTSFTIAFGRRHGNYVSGKIRSAIEGKNFTGPSFSETLDLSRVRGQDPAWEIGSTVVLPKLANTHQLVHVNDEPFLGDYSRPVWVREPPFANRSAEFYFRARELKSIEPFDLARTFENHRKLGHTLVASQRFYRFCRELELPIRWQPVRIDPD